MKLFLKIACCALWLSLSFSGWAIEPLYKGIFNLNAGNADDDLLDDESFAYKVGLGYQLDEHFSLNAEYVDLGSYDIASFSELDQSGVNLSLVSRIPINSIVTPFFRLGMFFWDVELEYFGSTFKADGEDPAFGIGVDVEISPGVSARIELERFEVDDGDVDLLSAGLLFFF